MNQTPTAVYIHTPFCPSKCGYCDFNSFAMEGEIIDATVAAMRTEILSSRWRGRPAKAIFFGGGTPTFLSSAQLCGLLECVMEVHPPIPGAEITSEANPGTVDWPKFRDMKAAGFNRLSLGAQSFLPEDLVRLGRVHGPSEIGRAVGEARKAGFDNLNLDLMFALPGQSEIAWRKNLRLALELNPEHLSLYCLTIEPNTRYYRLNLRGMLDLPDDEVQVAMYDDAVAAMTVAGFEQYEISNFARPHKECQHNLCYWRAEEYLAYGPGAVGCVEIEPGRRLRYTNMKHPRGYCEAIAASPTPVLLQKEVIGRTTEGIFDARGRSPDFGRDEGVASGPAPLHCETEWVDSVTLRTETIMLGLRTKEGVAASILPEIAISQLVAKGWLELHGERAILTPRGFHFHNEVCAELI
ncbi:MAG: radical SAM family heme chaperone HemW [Armatimonadetes bacterium]|nr:radical SAM family heme chaperone HemW [Armatimonadota bacterium]